MKCNVIPGVKARREREDGAKTNGGNFDTVVLGVQDKVVLMLYMTYCDFFFF